MGTKAFFTDEQYRYARYEASALDYAVSCGYHLFKSGNCYRMKEHDSMVFTADGRWFWNSRSLRGRAIEFAMNYEDKTLPEAVLAICGKSLTAAPRAAIEQRPLPKEKNHFSLPPQADQCRRLFAYLCGTRNLEREIVAELIKSEDLYESCTKYRKANGETGEAHNAVFVGRDCNGIPRSAFQRGLSSDAEHPFKMDVAGSDPAAPFCIHGYAGVSTVAVFEASIDAISHASIYKLAKLDYRSIDRISLGGTEKTVGLTTYLSEHPALKKILLCYDEDTGGEAAASRTIDLIGNRFEITRVHQNGGKDWNDYLAFWTCALRSGVCRCPTSGGAVYTFGDSYDIAAIDSIDNLDEYRETVNRYLMDGKKIVALSGASI